MSEFDRKQDSDFRLSCMLPSDLLEYICKIRKLRSDVGVPRVSDPDDQDRRTQAAIVAHLDRIERYCLSRLVDVLDKGHLPL